VLVDLYII